MDEISCGTDREPSHLLKCLMTGDVAEAKTLIYEKDLKDKFFHFNITDLSGIPPEYLNYIELERVEVICRFSLCGMAVVFGNEDILKLVLDTGASLTNPCRIFCRTIEENPELEDWLNLFVEVEAAFLITKLTMFHKPVKYRLMEILRSEHGLDLSAPASIEVLQFDENIDISNPEPWLNPGSFIGCASREQSLLETIAHELPLDALDRYCKLYPHTLLVDGCFHLGKCLKLADHERFNVLVRNGLQHRPSVAKKYLNDERYGLLFVDNGRYRLSFDNVSFMVSSQDSKLTCSYYYGTPVVPPIPEAKEALLVRLAELQFMCGYEFEIKDIPQSAGYWLSARHRFLVDYVRRLKLCFEQWNRSTKTLSYLARNVIRTSIRHEGFEALVRQYVQAPLLCELILCNDKYLNDFHELVKWPTEELV